MTGYRKRMLFAALAAVLLYFVYHFREALVNVASTVSMAAVLCVLLMPLCSFLESKGLSSTLASILSVLVLLLLITVTVSVFVPYLIVHSVDLVKRCTPALLSMFHAIDEMTLDAVGAWLRQSGIGETVTALASGLTASITRAGAFILSLAGQFLFSLIIVGYLLKERQTIGCHLMLMIPTAWRKMVLSSVQGCASVMLGYLSGVAKTSLFVASATYFSLLLLGIPNALLLALFMGLFEVLPYIGPVMASIPIVLSSLQLGAGKTMLALAVLVLIQQAESNFVGPYVTASSTSIHPLCALLAVFVFASLFGFWGILIAVPAVVLLRSIFWSLLQMYQTAKT